MSLGARSDEEETTIAAEPVGKVKEVHVATGTQVEAGDLLITLE